MHNHEDSERTAELALTLFGYFTSGKLNESTRLIHDWADTHGYRSAIEEVLEPALVRVGTEWTRDNISLAAGYLAGKVAEDTINIAIAKQEVISEYKGTAVIGNSEDDYHSLGRKLVGIFLMTAGWKVVDLGNDVLAKTFVDTALAEGAHVIGVSAMMLTTARNILSVRKEIDSRGLASTLKLAVGGAVFKMRPELVTEVGGDGMTLTAVDVPSLFERLQKEATS